MCLEEVKEYNLGNKEAYGAFATSILLVEVPQ